MFGLFRRKKKAPLVATITNGPGTYGVDVVGESNYQSALSSICGGKTEDGHNKVVEVYLIPEDDNPYDDKAVMVVVSGSTVGYLDRQTARNFRQRMLEVAPEGMAAKCSGKIVGGWNRGGGDEGHFGVRLDLPVGK